MAVVHVINSGQSVNCARGIIITGVNCASTWTPKTMVCPTVVASGWDTRWDDICYYATCSGGV